MRENTADLRLDLRDACRRLTARQREVMRLTALGFTQEQIGAWLGIERSVVSRHGTAARRKLEQALK